MANWTQADWATAALMRLGVVAVGQSPTGNDQSLASDRAAMVYAQLRGRGLAPFDISSIPDYAKEQLEVFLADSLSDHFGISGEKLAKIKSAVLPAERSLRAQIAMVKPPFPVVHRWY